MKPSNEEDDRIVYELVCSGLNRAKSLQAELERLTSSADSEGRRLDRSLQRLRKGKKIVYGKSGWQKKGRSK